MIRYVTFDIRDNPLFLFYIPCNCKIRAGIPMMVIIRATLKQANILHFFCQKYFPLFFFAWRKAVIPPLILNTFLNPPFNKIAAAAWARPPLRQTVIISFSLYFSNSFNL